MRRSCDGLGKHQGSGAPDIKGAACRGHDVEEDAVVGRWLRCHKQRGGERWVTSTNASSIARREEGRGEVTEVS